MAFSKGSAPPPRRSKRPPPPPPHTNPYAGAGRMRWNPHTGQWTDNRNVADPAEFDQLRALYVPPAVIPDGPFFTRALALYRLVTRPGTPGEGAAAQRALDRLIAVHGFTIAALQAAARRSR